MQSLQLFKMKPKPNSKDLNPECWIESCHNKSAHKFDMGGKEVLICEVHYHRFKKQEIIEEAKRKRNENK